MPELYNPYTPSLNSPALPVQAAPPLASPCILAAAWHLLLKTTPHKVLRERLQILKNGMKIMELCITP